MKKIFSSGILLSFLFFLMGCTVDGQITSFTEHRDPRPQIQGDASKRMKISPGSVVAVGTESAMQATITPTERLMQNSQASAIMTLGQNRME